ncbi:MAG: rhodanese-like domain-containing protein [Thermoanaerobaculia bacterium]
MSLRRHLLDAATLVLAAILCALVANALASRERKLAPVGSYPNALKVPEGAARQEAPLTATPAASAPAKSPFEEKRPGPSEKPTPRATSLSQGSEARNPSSSPADLLKRFPPHNKPSVEISGDDAAWLVARGVLTLDARRTKDYEQGHIALARSFPVWESDIDVRVTALVGESRDGAIPVVLYCSGGDCEDSHILAQKLFGAGFNNLLVYRDGWPDWVKRGGSSATGPES